MTAPVVSIIVPNYNHARFLRKRIETIFAQTYQDFELILLDDCSTDDSQSILSEYSSHPRVTHVEFNTVNSGSTFKQWNKGIRLARGKYIWLAESDDYADQRLLERLVSILDSDPQITFAFCRSWRVVGEDGNISGFAVFGAHESDPMWQQDFRVNGRELCEEYFLGDTPVPNASAVVFRRAPYNGVGGVDETLRTSGDRKLWAAMALAGKVGYLGEPLNYYRSHEGTVRSAIWRGRRPLAVVYVKERLEVALWVAKQVKGREAEVEKARQAHALHWVPLIASPEISLQSKREILALVRQCDPRPLGRFLRTAPGVLRSIVWDKAIWAFRNAFWHPALKATRAVRHPLRLDRANISAILKRIRVI